MLAAGLTVSCVISGVPIKAALVYAATAEEKNVFSESGNRIKATRISSTEDFLNFAKRLQSDSDSEGKTWVLTDDIDLSGTDFGMISIFAGTLDGCGHTISGFNFEENGSNIGFIRVLAKNGLVRNLRVEGNVNPESGMNDVGIMVGSNYGCIEDCTVSGNAFGMEAVGGAAGHNMESGRIVRTVNYSTVTGMRRTGGIAGFNEGTIIDSENAGEVNAGRKTAWEINDEREKVAESEDDSDDDEIRTSDALSKLNPDGIDLKDDDLSELLQNDQKVNYTGGIAGASSGTISGCINNGVVGYDHTGYKTGGIVGYERGILSSCSNNGAVSGRKNTGGIAGQLEPYCVNAYHEDALDTTRAEADTLVDDLAELQKIMEQEDLKAQTNIDSIRGTADDLRGTVSGYKEYYRNKDDQMESEIRSHTSEVRSIIEGLDPDLVNGDTKNAFKALRADLNDLSDLMDAAEKAAGSGVSLDMTNYSSKLMKLSSDILTQVDSLLGDGMKAGESLRDTEKDLERLRDASNSLDDTLRIVYDSYKNDFRATDENITSKIDTLASEMDTLNEELKESDSRVRGKTGEINETLKRLNTAVNDSFDQITNVLERYRNTDDINDIFDDISDDSDNTPAQGRITQCTNTGVIRSDINGGGIVGMADTDVDIQSDFEVVSSGQVSLKYDRTKRATVIDCTNYGYVKVQNSNAGGIAGSMDIGAVLSSYNFGNVRTEDGDYAGGITGKSRYVIRDCFSMTSISGNKYLGGVAGFGRRVIGNRAMADIQSAGKEYTGVIAGDIDDKESTVSQNIYVENELGAVNGLTYDDQARAVTYEEFIAIPNTPDDAKTMHVSYIADGNIVQMIEVPYGGSISNDDHPELPIVGDKFGIWEDTDLTDIRRNITIQARYISLVTTVASDEPFPVMLVSGNFYKGTTLTYTEQTPSEKLELPEGFAKILKKYTYQIHADYGTIGEKWVVRLLADGVPDDAKAAVIKDGKLTALETEKDGKYLVFSMDGDGTFYILGPVFLWVIPLVAGISAAAILVLAFILTRKKKEEKVKEKEKQNKA